MRLSILSASVLCTILPAHVLHLALCTQVVPFLLEDKLKELGAVLQKADADWGELVVTDGNLITGQNPGERGMQFGRQNLHLGSWYADGFFNNC